MTKLSSCLDFNPSGIPQADLPKPPGLGHSSTTACEHLPEMHRAHSKDKFLSCFLAVFLCHTPERSDAVPTAKEGVSFNLVLKWGGAPDREAHRIEKP